MSLRGPIVPSLVGPMAATFGSGLPWESGGGGAALSPPAVTISGTRGVGLTLTATATGSPTLTYQWQSGATIGGGGSWANIGGATSSTFADTATTAPYDIRCVVTNAAGSANSNTIAAQTPSTILGANLTGWFDDGSATFTGASWVDRDGTGNLTQGTGSLQPASGTAINGHASLLFDGADDFMSGSAVSNRFTATAALVWAVFRTKTLANGAAGASNSDGLWGDRSGYIGQCCTKTTNGARGFTFTSAYKDTTPDNDLVDNTVYASHFYIDGSGTLHCKHSGFSEGTIASATSIGLLTGLLDVGRNYTGNYTNVEIAALIFGNVVPSAQQIADLNAWASAYGGVSLT